MESQIKATRFPHRTEMASIITDMTDKWRNNMKRRSWEAGWTILNRLPHKMFASWMLRRASGEPSDNAGWHRHQLIFTDLQLSLNLRPARAKTICSVLYTLDDWWEKSQPKATITTIFLSCLRKMFFQCNLKFSHMVYIYNPELF